MRCEVCGHGQRVPARKPYVEERDGRVAVVTSVPVTTCDACGETWLAADVAHTLDSQLSEMLATELVAIRAFSEPHAVAA